MTGETSTWSWSSLSVTFELILDWQLHGNFLNKFPIYSQRVEYSLCIWKKPVIPCVSDCFLMCTKTSGGVENVNPLHHSQCIVIVTNSKRNFSYGEDSTSRKKSLGGRGFAVCPSYEMEVHNYDKLCCLILIKYIWNQIICQYYSWL